AALGRRAAARSSPLRPAGSRLVPAARRVGDLAAAGRSGGAGAAGHDSSLARRLAVLRAGLAIGRRRALAGRCVRAARRADRPGDCVVGGTIVSELELRRATWADREALLDMLARAFSWPAPPQLDFLAMMPHLFGERRIPDHLLALDGGQIIGVVGIYGYELKIDGVRLRGAALGQVATVPERRGQRVMSTLLRAATRLIE